MLIREAELVRRGELNRQAELKRQAELLRRAGWTCKGRPKELLPVRKLQARGVQRMFVGRADFVDRILVALVEKRLAGLPCHRRDRLAKYRELHRRCQAREFRMTQ